ncbi:MAG: GNAT family N-acetyltransferase [Pseudomonadota bacterium]
MTLRLRIATAADLPAIIAIIQDDTLGRARETDDPAPYAAAFARIEASPNDTLFVAIDDADVIVGCFELSAIPGLSRQGMTRGQIESVRIRTDRRGRGYGAAMMALAEAEARRRGCGLMQLSTSVDRVDAHRFYERLGYAATHKGMKKLLSG